MEQSISHHVDQEQREAMPVLPGFLLSPSILQVRWC
jgi:hypothetical protein